MAGWLKYKVLRSAALVSVKPVGNDLQSCIIGQAVIPVYVATLSPRTCLADAVENVSTTAHLLKQLYSDEH